ncbi:SusD family protein [Filimonas lacunae]|uniref:SusD family protein n=1 Tax=Filimonas lacunae TaxID=477680 RepID=A0A173MIN0_9BACT|nr:RagB/SusD family nutrient uptake outer membrane protein [Filimonas lacunae]BAV07484.1 hypothetical protein FLA_3510 [Filimonas lacunae]SIT30208.1 SusD family protein [Filimonas lacunae]
MKPYKYLFVLLASGAIAAGTSCKKQLNIENPNNPTLGDAQTESGITLLAKGAIYQNGFNGVSLSGLNWLGSSFFSLCYGYQELLADNIAATASNQSINTINLPAYVQLDDNTKITNTSNQRTLLRTSNARSARPSNAFYYEWGYMYSLNNACNNLLTVIPNVTFSGDAATKSNTLKAWAYWWKGYAYSRIGSLYYAGLINNTALLTNNHYVVHDSIVAEANRNLDAAATILSGISNTDDYEALLTQLIPEFTIADHGGVLTPTMWLHNINTLKARNLITNKEVSAMTSADWNTLLTLTSNGIEEGDYVFTARTTSTNGFMSASSGSATAMSTGPSKTFTISERLIQEYKTGDQRLSNNYVQRSTPVLNQVGGFTFSTRWYLKDAGNGISGTVTLSDLTPGNFELYINGSYEENALTRAEALIYTGSIEQGLALIDAVRAYQGADLPAVAGTGLSLDAAKEELRRERRVALVFRGTAFYDARRWGVIKDVSAGGGRSNAVVLTSAGVLNTHAIINYNFLSYWDVPADETELNAPDATSAAVTNPN